MSLKMVWKRSLSLILLAGAFALGLPHCGVEGNPFYLSADPTRVRSDVPDAASNDIATDTASDTATEDHVVVTDVTQVADAADVTDAAEAADATDAANVFDAADAVDTADVILVADALDEQMLTDLVTVDAADVPVFADVTDAADAVDATDVITDATDVVDVVLAMDVVDVPPAVDRPDVVMTPDRPDVVQPDIPPPPPEFVVEYISVSGGDVVPSSTGGNLSSISIAFFESSVWRWRSYPATRFTRDGSSNWFRVTIETLTPEQRATPRVLLSIVEGCGLNTGGDCPSGWWSQWRVTWLGVLYTGSAWLANENRVTCRDFGGFNQGCVRFVTP